MSLKRSDLFKKWNKDKRHTYDLSDTLDACPSLDIAFIYSGRNRGKSFEIAAQCLADAWYDLKQFAYIRRNDATAYEIENYFNDKHDFISDMTDGLYTGIAYYKGQLCFYVDKEDPKTGKLKRDLGRVAGSFFAVSRQSSYKSQQYPEIFNALFEVSSELRTEDKDVVLLREPKDAGYYEFSAKDDLVIDNKYQGFTPDQIKKSFLICLYI